MRRRRGRLGPNLSALRPGLRRRSARIAHPQEVSVKILVTVKRVPDAETTIKINPEGNGIVEAGIKWVVNPFDEYAIEEALRIKEKGGGAEVVLVSIGKTESQEQLRTGLAMGADRAILVKSATELDQWAVARILVKIVEKEKPDLVLMGKQAIDDDSNVVGQMLAQLLGRSSRSSSSQAARQPPCAKSTADWKP
jgi:electron transfer flavoprotein beta subunit